MKPMTDKQLATIRKASDMLQDVRDLVSEVYHSNLEFAGDMFKRNPDINRLENEIKLTNKLRTVIPKR